MAKIKLGNRPKNFKKTISVPMLDGTSGTIECLFKYRTRKEFGEFVDGLTEAARAEGKAAEESAERDGQNEPKPFSLKDHLEKTVGANAQYILEILEGWNLDVELSRESLEQLADELPGATAAIVETYRTAITEGRLGN
ncbi:phage tail assembly chaperone [Acidovorax sp. NCPPB 3576]|uniref:phage tail assembly chaperone n=1 Tax=Acidovorax sp. NCPPB 3576 TaxID=2940488 RepID=UPI00234964E0|nr:phage tail assembly chaperone [Acidovorax sp. NCPPB 3576]WCM86647.1 phage tail assembly chaperone [Acidovorax sp. NCPPB 3576]WCM88848.1 phage tail assembly chaperone [Acidovorax sp. NCPPB 3576]